MAIFRFLEFQHYTGDDAMFENFGAMDWTPLEAETLDEAAAQVMVEMQLYHPNVTRWDLLTERLNGGDDWAYVWVEAPHAGHYLLLGDRAQDAIWLFAIVPDPLYHTIINGDI